MANRLDSDIINKFKLQSCYDIHFWTNTLGKGMILLILPSYGLNYITAVVLKDGFGIKWPAKVDMPLNKTKNNHMIEI